MIPRTMPVGVILLTVIFSILSLTIFGSVNLASLEGGPIPHVVFAYLVVGKAQAIIMALVSV